jgi:hypothetical protein
MTKQIIVETCKECPYARICKIIGWVYPESIPDDCPLPDHTPAGVALTSDGRTMDVFVEGNEVI